MNPTRRAHPDSEHHDEARELRRIISEQRDEIERLQKASYTAYKWLRALNTHIEAPVDRDPMYAVEQPEKHRSVMAQLEDALNGGGDDHADD